MYRPTHHHGVSEIDDNLALIYLHSIYSADMTMHLYLFYISNALHSGYLKYSPFI